MKFLRLLGRLYLPTLVATIGFLYALFAWFMIGWGWSDSLPRGWSASQWGLTVAPWSIPFLISLWVVYRLSDSSIKLAVLAELLAACFVLLPFIVREHSGRGPGIGGPHVLLEANVPVVESTELTAEPNLPLSHEAVGIESSDGTFNPIMFLAPPFGQPGYKTPLLTYNLAAGPPQLAVYRGTNGMAASNHFLGRFQVLGCSKTKPSVQLMVVFFLDEKHQLSLQVREVDSQHNTALKIKQLKSGGAR